MVKLNEWWKDLVRRYRMAKALEPMSMEEAERELANAQEVPLTKEEIDEIVRKVTADPGGEE